MKCKRCHREIINPKSVQHGYGPVCWIKMQKSNNDNNGEPGKPVKVIKEFKRRFGIHALVRIRSAVYTLATWNYYLKKWVAGDGFASTPDGAVAKATYDTLCLFKTQKKALSFYGG